MDYTVTIQEETEKVTQAVVHKSVEITDGQYGHYIYKKDEMIYIPCGGAVFVKNSITEVETCKQYLTLYFDSGDGKRRTILFPREDLVENKIVSLTAYGVQVSKKTADYLIKSIENQEVNVKHLLCHAKLGMAEWNGEKIFKGAKGVGIDSKYTGKLRVSKERYLCKLQEDVKARCHRTYTNGVFTVSVYQRIVGGLSERKYQRRKYYGAYDWRIFYRKKLQEHFWQCPVGAHQTFLEITLYFLFRIR